MSLPEKYAGQHVQCPNCHVKLRIPSAKENQALARWFCKCGLRLKARTRTAGRKIRCPRCSAVVTVPFTDSHPSYVEDYFVMDEAAGVVQKAPEKAPQQELILDPLDPPAEPPSPKDEDTTAYKVEPAPDAKPASPSRPPASSPKTGAKKLKKPDSLKAAEDETRAEDAEDQAH